MKLLTAPRQCEHCKAQMRKRLDEWRETFMKRRYCSRDCASKALHGVKK